MHRVMIIGQPGSGKSTLARQLGQRTGLPVFHMDHIHWQPGWVERPKAEKIRLAMEIEARPSWIFEGGLSATYTNRVARADTLIWLDFPLSVRLWRVLKRTLRYLGQTRPDLPKGCREGFTAETVPFWRYIWRTRHSGRRRIEVLFGTAPPQSTLVHLRSLAEVKRFLQSLPRG
jgi:adenylate kinase family enzyme